MFNLAKWIANAGGRSLMPESDKIATDTFAQIQRSNVKFTDMANDFTFGQRNSRRAYNINSGRKEAKADASNLLPLAVLWAVPVAAQIIPPTQGINVVSSGSCVSGNCATWNVPNSAPSLTAQDYRHV